MGMTSRFVTGTIAPVLGITKNALGHPLPKCLSILGFVPNVLHRAQLVIPGLQMVIMCLPPMTLHLAPMLPLLPFQMARQAPTVTPQVVIPIPQIPLICLL